NISYSLDSGHTWKPTTAAPAPESRSGSIAVSADGATWGWTPERQPSYVSGDMGATWKPAQGLPTGTRVIADPIEPHSFYAISLPTRTLYRSTDGAASFTAQSVDLPSSP